MAMVYIISLLLTIYTCPSSLEAVAEVALNGTHAIDSALRQVEPHEKQYILEDVGLSVISSDIASSIWMWSN